MLAARITLLLAAVAAFTAQGALAQTNYSSIAEAATASNLTSLLAAVNATGLTATLSTFQGIVLAPDNAAFAALGANAPSGDALRAVLLYHVLPGATALPTGLPAVLSALPSSEGVNNNVTVQGTQGAQLALGVAPGAKVKAGPVTAGNATVYIIDAVLLPPSTSATPLKTVNYSTLAEAVRATTGLSKLLELATNDTDIAALLSNPDVGLTVFAPTDAAFETFLDSIEGGAQPSADLLKSVLLNHVVATPILSTGIPTTETNVTTAANGTLTAVRSANGTVTVTSSSVTTANVVAADVLAGKSVVHVVDQVLAPTGPSDGPAPPVGSGPDYQNIPAALAGVGGFAALAGLVNATGLTDTLANPNFTAIIFAPTDEAFQSLNASGASKDFLRTVLLYHVVPTTTPRDVLSATVGNLTTAVEAADNITPSINVTSVGNNEVLLSGIAPGVVVNLTNSLTAGNSRIYPITSVLVPPIANETVPYLTIAALAQNTANLTILTQLVVADSDVLALASNPNAVATVFAPTNSSFTALAAQLQAANMTLPAPGSAEAKLVLLTHVLNRPWTAESLLEGDTTVATLSGQNVTITKNGLSVSVRGPGNNESIPVVMADNLAGKSVVHVINGVILPDFTVPIASSPPPAPAFIAPPPAGGAGVGTTPSPPPAGGAATTASASTPLMVLSALLGALMMVTMAAGSRV